MTRPLRVCFHASQLWPLWSGGRIAFTGGAEVQQAQIAKGFAARGIEMTVVTCDYGQASPTTVDGVRVLKTYRIEDGPPVLRFFHPRLTRTMSALHAATADVYYARGGSLEAGESYLAARRRGAAFVFGAAHDHDARASLPLLGSPRDRWLYRRALRGADAIVAQTIAQQELFRAEFGLESTLVRNLVELPETAADPGHQATVVWLATYKDAKRPDWFVELARRLPGVRFRMHGVVPPPPESDAAWHATREAARVLPNLEVGEYLDRAGVRALLATAALFVHTSPVEGFPNTVLEAWASGVPSIAAVDPDGIVAREGIGATIADLPGLVREVERWMADPESRRTSGARARAYVAREHAPGPTLERLAAVLERAASARRSASA